MSHQNQTARTIPFFGSVKRVGNHFSTTSLNLLIRPCDHGYQIVLIARRTAVDGKETSVEVPSPHIAVSEHEARMIVAETVAPFIERLMVGGSRTIERVH